MANVNRWVVIILSFLVAVSLVPFACIAKSRVVRSRTTQIHVFPDMDSQGKLKPQQSSPMFADGRADRPPVPGTVPRGGLEADDHTFRGVVDGDWASEFPMPVTETVLQRGQERYAIFCAPCHGLSGYGDGIVARRADTLAEGTWVPPSSYHTELVRTRPVGHLFNSATHGIRNMAGYGSQIPTDDRWAIVAYIRALQRSQDARIEDVPPELRPQLR